MTKTGLEWLDSIKELGSLFVSEGRELAERKLRLERELDEIRKQEVALWIRIGETGKWTRAEMGAALTKMSPDLLQFLPESFPKPARRRRASVKTGPSRS